MDLGKLTDWGDIARIATPLLAIVGGLWAFRKWYRRDEEYPRLVFDVDVTFLGRAGDSYVCELTARLENKGVVPIEIAELSHKSMGLGVADRYALGGASIRHQLRFTRPLTDGSFIPPDWPYSHVYPGVATTYGFVTLIPCDIAFVRIEADLAYTDRAFETHHAGKVVATPSAPPPQAPAGTAPA